MRCPDQQKILVKANYTVRCLPTENRNGINNCYSPFLPLLLLVAGACTPDFDPVEVVKDLRILGIRAEPPEVLLDAEPAVWPTVRVDALVVDPAAPIGFKVDWELWGCPTSSTESTCCPREGECTAATGRALLGAGITSPEQIVVDVALDRASYQAALAGDVQLGLGGVPLLVELRVRRDGGPWQRGVKRLVYGVYDQVDLTCVPDFSQEAIKRCIEENRCEQFLTACRQGGACVICNGIPKQDVVTQTPKRPNQNPRVDFLKLSLGQEAEDGTITPTTWQVLGDDPTGKSPVSVKGGERQVLLPRPEPNGRGYDEPYVIGSRIPSYDKNTQTLQYTLVRKEYLTYHFYVSQGDLSHATTGGPPNVFFEDRKVKDITSVWTPATPAEGQGVPLNPDGTQDARVWIVVHDDRGGVGWLSARARVKVP